MNKIFSLFVGICLLSGLTACMDSHDEPNTDRLVITATGLPEANATILSVKERYASSISTSNTFEQVHDDVIFEGIVVGNDVSGNLYQTLVLRHIGSQPGATDDQCIQVGIKHTILYPYFPLGQRVRINLKGLYIGNYSRVPKVGEPYYTSSGNLRLGPILMPHVAQNIELVGKPDLNAPELTPRDLTTASGESWLRASANRTYLNTPLLATVRGTIQEVQGAAAQEAETGALSGELEPLPKIFAPEALYDAGYAVNRNLTTTGGNTVTLRTSTQNDLSFLPIPSDARTYTGVLSYYSSWQMTLRSADDIQPKIQ